MAGYNGKACEDFISRRRRSAGLHASANSANGFLVAIRKRATTAASWKQKAAQVRQPTAIHMPIRQRHTNPTDHQYPRANRRPHETGSCDKNATTLRDALRTNRGSDGWKIKGIAGCIPRFRTAIENCGVSAIPIDEINGTIGLPGKCEIADDRAGRKLTQRMRPETISFWLRVKKLANTCFGLDLIGRNPRF